MTQLNSPTQTALQRRYLPVVISLILLGGLGAMLVPSTAPLGALVPGILVLGSVATAYFGIYLALIYRAADRVVLDGDVLRVNRGQREALIPVASVAAIRSISRCCICAFSAWTILASGHRCIRQWKSGLKLQSAQVTG